MLSKSKDGINVLSLFDGMSCGQIALERAGIKVNHYHASEIDSYAIKVTMDNYPQTIQMGSVTELEDWELPKIDLLIGGSPCQGFSFAGKQLAFDDERSKLFFEYVRLLKELKPKYFLLENVRMKKESENVISDYLGVEPIAINSKVFTPCDRKRLYWTNIPFDTNIYDEGLVLSDIISDGCLEDITSKMYAKKIGTLSHKKAWSNVRTTDKVARCLTTAGQGVSNSGCTNIKIGERFYRPTAKLSEKLQGVPEDYTCCVSNTQRHRMLGNGWTVNVISHIFEGLNNVI